MPIDINIIFLYTYKEEEIMLKKKIVKQIKNLIFSKINNLTLSYILLNKLHHLY